MHSWRPDRHPESALVGAWDQQYAGHAIGEIELFPDRTYTEHAYPASPFAATLYREIGGQDCRGPWQVVSSNERTAGQFALHLRMHDVSFPCLGILAPLAQPFVRLYDWIMDGRMQRSIVTIAPEKIVFQHGEVWTRREFPPGGDHGHGDNRTDARARRRTLLLKPLPSLP